MTRQRQRVVNRGTRRHTPGIDATQGAARRQQLCRACSRFITWVFPPGDTLASPWDDERRDRALPGDPVGAGRAGLPLSGLPDHAGTARVLLRGRDAHLAVRGAACLGLDRAGQYRVGPPALAEYHRLRAGLLRRGGRR
ncbi:hypothetical protein G6F32_015275 [Rhizopus arrhizus]|nr:hypothetical protein G6F32_015275 [Rhizopus arrhizus]